MVVRVPTGLPRTEKARVLTRAGKSAVGVSAQLLAMMILPAAAKDERSAQDDISQAIIAAVAADWPNHDREGKGHLTRAQFSSWLSALRASGRQHAEDPARVRAWAAESFRAADIDRNSKVTQKELSQFLIAKMKK